MTIKLGFLASHGGSSMRAIVQAIATGELDAEPRVVISNNSKAPALLFAAEQAIPTYHLSDHTEQTPERLDEAICGAFVRHGVELVVLSGYMKKLGPCTLYRYHNRVLNIHPALLPKFGGQGMYGNFVHAAVLGAGEKVSGATIHLVDPEYDHGRVLAQREVTVLPGDTVDLLAERVRSVEPSLYVDVLKAVAAGKLTLDGC